MRLLTTIPIRMWARSLGIHARTSSRDEMLRPCCLTCWKFLFLRRRNARLSATMLLNGQTPTPFGAAGLEYTTPIAGCHALHKSMFTFTRYALGLPVSFHEKPSSPLLDISCKLLRVLLVLL